MSTRCFLKHKSCNHKRHGEIHNSGHVGDKLAFLDLYVPEVKGVKSGSKESTLHKIILGTNHKSFRKALKKKLLPILVQRLRRRLII